MSERVLLYMGAGWDFSFLNIPELSHIRKFILIDTLPKYKHYRKGQPGFPIQERFLEHIKEVRSKAGAHLQEETPKYLQWKEKDGKSIKYYYSMNAACLAHPLSDKITDIYISGYTPTWSRERWEQTLKYRQAYYDRSTWVDYSILSAMGRRAIWVGEMPPPSDSEEESEEYPSDSDFNDAECSSKEVPSETD